MRNYDASLSMPKASPTEGMVPECRRPSSALRAAHEVWIKDRIFSKGLLRNSESPPITRSNLERKGRSVRRVNATTPTPDKYCSALR